MPVPLALAVPAALAGAAYLNAKLSLGYDYRVLGSTLKAQFKLRMREKQDKTNMFYTLEEYALSKKGSNTLLIFQGRSWTYKDVYETSLKYGTWLKTKYDVKPKELIAMDFMNSDKFIFIWLGLWAIGAKPAFINYNLTGKALGHCIKVSKSRLLLVDLEIQDKITQEVRDELPDVQFEVFTPELEAEVLSTSGVREPDAARAGEKAHNIAMLIYTSGTTGLPKGAIVSWTKVVVGGGMVGPFMELTERDVFYTCMPLYHSAASVLGFGSVLVAGATLSLGKKFSTKTFWKDCRDTNASVIQYVGETCRYLLSAPPNLDPVTGENLDKKNSVRVAFGNGLRPDVWDRFKERFGIEAIAEFYAATEGAGGTWNFSRNEFSKGAIGRFGSLASAYLGPMIAIVELDWETETPYRDPETGLCRALPRGEIGELLYKLNEKNIEEKFQGYFNNKASTESKILRDVIKKGDAWFRTGDMISWDKEGRFYFNDRIGDTFRWKSENVSTNEVSEALGSHPVVHEANVYGVELPHHDGRAGCVAIVLAEEPSEKLMNDLASHASKTLPKYAVPLFIRMIKNMDITGTNKQQKSVVRAQGVDPEKVGGDEIYWLRDGTYRKFRKQDWEELSGGRVKFEQRLDAWISYRNASKAFRESVELIFREKHLPKTWIVFGEPGDYEDDNGDPVLLVNSYHLSRLSDDKTLAIVTIEPRDEKCHDVLGERLTDALEIRHLRTNMTGGIQKAESDMLATLGKVMFAFTDGSLESRKVARIVRIRRQYKEHGDERVVTKELEKAKKNSDLGEDDADDDKVEDDGWKDEEEEEEEDIASHVEDGEV